MTVGRASRLILAVVIAGLVVTYRARNPERQTLDGSARQLAPGRFLQLADGMTHYQVSGPDDGQRVVLVHGFSVPSYIWDSTSAALSAAGFRVARYDTFGRGFSDRPDVPYTLDLFDRQLQQLLDSLGWREPVDVVGLSMGGAVSAAFSGRHTERVRSLSLIDPVAESSGPLPAMFRFPLLGPVLWQILAVPAMPEGQLTDFVEPARWPDWTARYRNQMQYRGFGRALRSTLTALSAVQLDSVYGLVEHQASCLAHLGQGGQDGTDCTGGDHTRAIPAAQYHRSTARPTCHTWSEGCGTPLLIDFLRSTQRTDSTRIGVGETTTSRSRHNARAPYAQAETLEEYYSDAARTMSLACASSGGLSALRFVVR
jgi:pimeloyl-ACP methyl ester carboxylesterase